MDALVIYYHRSPRTRAAALAVANAVGAHAYAHDDTESAPPSSRRQSTPSRVERNVELARVEVVVVGTPAHDGALPTSIEAFLREKARAARSLAFFCTAGGAGGARALARMTELVRRDPIAALSLGGADIHGLDVEIPVGRFVRELEAAFLAAEVA
ncbi:MAG TPA: hypothetical protein VIF62_33980 [Labilithrix sp.]|jgi:hypothetical protein